MARLAITRRRLAALIAVPLVLLGLLATAPGVLLRQDGSRAWALGLIADLAGPAVARLDIAKVDGWFPYAFAIEGLSVADANGPWLEAGRIAADWTVPALLGGRLALERLALSNVALHRLPAAPPDDGAGPGGPPTLPLALRIGSLKLDGLSLGEPVLGEAMAFDATGAMSVEGPDRARAHLSARRTDAPGTALSLSADLDGRSLDLKGRYAEPTGGPVGRLAGLSGPLDITIDGAGPLSDWSGDLTAALADVGRLQARLGLALPDQRLTLAVDFRPGPPLSALTPGLDGVIGLTGYASWSENGAFGLDALSVDGPGWTLAGNAARTAEGHLSAALSVTVDVSRALPALPPPMALRGLSGRLGLSGRPDALEISGDVTGDGLALNDPGLAPLVGDTARLRWVAALTGSALDFKTLRLETGTARLDAPLSIDLERAQATGDATLALDDLSRLAALTGLDLDGRAEARLTRLVADAKGLSAGLDLRPTDFATGIAALDALFAGTPRLTSELTIGADRLALSDLTVRGPGGRLAGRVILPDQDGLDIALGGDVPALSKLSPALGVAIEGRGTLDLRVAGPFDTLTVDPAITLHSASVAGRPLPDGTTIKATWAVTADGLSGPVRIDAGTDRLAATVAMPAFGRLVLTGIDGRVADLALGGDLTLPFDRPLTDGNLSFETADVAPLAALAGVDATGAVSGRLTLTARADGQTLALSARSAALTAAGVSARDVAVEATVDNAFNVPTLSARLTSGEGGPVGLRWRRAAVTADGSLDALSVSADIIGQAETLTLSTAGTLQRTDTGSVIVLERLDGALRGATVGLAGPTRLSLGPGTMRLAPTSLTMGDGRVDVTLETGPKTLEGRLTLTAVPIAPLMTAAGLPLDGTASGGMTLSGRADAPTAAAQLTIDALRIVTPETDDAETARLALSADWTGRRIEARARLEGPAAPATATASIPFALKDGVPSTDGPLSGRLDWTGAVGPPWQLAGLPDHRLEGTATARIDLDGTVAAPRATLEARLDDGIYENLALGTLLTGLTARLSGDTAGTLAFNATASDGGEGRFSAEGAVMPSARAVTARLTLDRAMVARTDEAQARVSGRLELNGGPDGLLAAGDVTVDDARLKPLAAASSGVPTLKVREINVPDRLRATATPSTGAKGPPVTLDLRVSLPKRVIVLAPGLDSEWSGRLTIGGTGSDPSIDGALSAIRGTYSLVGKEFRLTRGTITFAAKERIDPLLDIVATHQRQDLTVEARVSGRASAPSITLTSQPPYPRDEIMARLLFGEGMQGLSQAQAIQVSAAVAQLSGGGDGALNIVDRLRAALDLDRLGVGGGESGPTVEAGTYVSDRVYVGAEQGAAVRSGAVKVEIEITPNISVETKAGADASGDVGINWKWDY